MAGEGSSHQRAGPRNGLASSVSGPHINRMTKNPLARDITPKVDTVAVRERRQAFVEASGADEPLRARMSQAAILVVPLPPLVELDHEGALFPSGTLEVLRYVERALPEPLTAQIAIDDSAYEELALHAADVLLPAIHVAGHVLADVAVGILSSYLYDRLRDAIARRETRVRSTLYIEVGDRTVKVSYDGPVDAFGATLGTALREAVAGATSDANQQLAPAVAASSTSRLPDRESESEAAGAAKHVDRHSPAEKSSNSDSAVAGKKQSQRRVPTSKRRRKGGGDHG